MIRNPLTWCLWATSALLAAFTQRNPFLQGLLMLVLVNVWLPYRGGRSGYLRVALALAVIPVLFSVALSRFGHHVLFVVPAIPIIGGAWTWEALAFGASSGAALLLAVGVFRILQATVHSADLVALLPRFLYRTGTVFALSVAFAPRTVASFQSIREARRIRGRHTGWRSTPALLVPLLLTTLEQALQYAESLDARGYASNRRSRYRPVSWSFADGVIMAASIGSLIVLALFPSAYNPYAHLTPAAPSLAPILGVLLLATPALLMAVRRAE